MKTFAELLKLIEKEYSFDACYIADHLHSEDEIVRMWEKGILFPDSEKAEAFADMFALPLSLVKDFIEEGKRHEPETLPDNSGL